MGGGGVQPQMTGYNPFMAGLGGGMNAQMTGMPGAGAGMMQPQATGFSQQQQQQQPFMQEQPFMQAQPTGFLQPQATGFNPFRQSMLMPQGTGMGAFGGGGMQQPQQTGLSPFGSMMPAGVGPDPNSNPQNGQQQQQQQNQTSLNAAFGSQPPNTSSVPTPTTSTAPTPSALKPQKTGSRNPFAPPPGETPPPTPPPPTNAPSLSQLAAGAFTGGGRYGLGANAWDGSNPATQTQQQPVQNHQEQQKPLGPQPTGIIGSVASEFAFGRNNAASPAPAPALSPSATGMPGSSGNANANGLGSSFGMLSISGASSPGIQSASSAPQAQLQPQPTGFGGSAIKPFKPESAFGAELAASRTFSPPPTNAFSPGPSENAGRGMSSAASSSALSAQPTSGANPFARFSVSPAPGASGAGSSLAPSATGAQGWTSFGGAGNGIGAPSNFLTSSSNGSNGLNSSTSAPSLAPQPTGFGGSTIKPFQPTSAFGTSVLGAGAGAQGQAGQNGLNGQQNPNTGANSGTTFGTLF